MNYNLLMPRSGVGVRWPVAMKHLVCLRAIYSLLYDSLYVNWVLTVLFNQFVTDY